MGCVVKEYVGSGWSLEPQTCDLQWWLQKEEMAMSVVRDWVWSVKYSFKL